MYIILQQKREVFMKRILFAVMSLAFTISAAEPVLKVGIISDTHVKKNESSCNILAEAFKLFKSHNVDVIVNAGDIADVHNEQAYKNYCNTVKKIYPSKKPQEIFAFAWHDRIKRNLDPQEKVFADIKKHLKITHKMYDKFNIKGCTFLVFPQEVDFKRYDETIALAVKENPDKPIFVIDHVPAFNTVYNSMTWGNRERRNILDKYPQVVHLSGHVHGTLTNELNIWQGNFTAVNAGCLNTWAGALIGNTPASMKSDMAMIMEVYPEKIVFRRFFSVTKTEYQPDTPWIVPLPFDKNNAPYNFERRKNASSAPEFAEKAELKAKVTEKNVLLSFPQALHQDGVFNYKITLKVKKDGKWVQFARKDIMGNFMHEGKKRTRAASVPLSIGYFDVGKSYRAEVVPVHFFGREGKALAVEFEVKSKPAATVVYETSNPMKDCPYFSGIEGGEPMKLADDGFYNNDSFNTRLLFPDHIWDGKKGMKFRFTVDMYMKQSDLRGWTLVLRNPTPLVNANARIQTPAGDNGVSRYVIEFVKQGDAYKYYLLVREGEVGKIRFDYIKLERLD